MANVRFEGVPAFLRNPIPQEKRRVGIRQGALLRTIARRSIRKRARPSRPGDPPRSKTGLLRNFIFYSWDPASQSVIVGAQRLSGKGLGQAPARLEHGDRNRPFMVPALQTGKSKLPELWRGAIKG